LRLLLERAPPPASVLPGAAVRGTGLVAGLVVRVL